MGFPRMNYEVIASPAARAISGKKSFRCDLCWPEARLDVEYQSKENHEGELSRIRDSRRANALAAMGWTVLGVTNDEPEKAARAARGIRGGDLIGWRIAMPAVRFWSGAAVQRATLS